MLEHDNIDSKSHHCHSGPDYRLADCLRRKSNTEVGCETFWTNLTAGPRCEISSRILENMENYNRMVNKERTRLYRDTGCYDPCHYYEYKVGATYIFSKSKYCLFLQLPGGPQLVPNRRITEITLIFGSKTILLEREQLAFTFLSLLADCGGILGLFVGFNFLMVWDVLTAWRTLATSH